MNGQRRPLPANLGGAQAKQQDAHRFAEEAFDWLSVLLLHAISQGSQAALSSNDSVHTKPLTFSKRSCCKQTRGSEHPGTELMQS
jgi:hypothetical protein